MTDETPCNSALDAVLRETRDARGLPNACYTAEAAAAVERERVFGRSWSCVGRASDVPRQGEVVPVDLYGLPLMLVRGADERVRVFHNVCSHRGQLLVREACKVQGMIRCPYHSWTYGLDGDLRGTPHLGGVGVHELAGFDRAQHGLKPVRSQVWADQVFVDLSGEAPAFADFIAPLAERWAPLWGAQGPDLLRITQDGSTLEMEVQANWKLAVENYCEAYHLPWVHPSLNSYSKLEDHYNICGARGFSGQGVVAYNLVDVAGTSLPRFPAWPAERERTAEYVSLFPNLLLGLQADHFFALLIRPISPTRTREELRVYYVGDEGRQDRYEASRRAVLESWRVVFGEDVWAVEGMQAGRASPAFGGGVFSPEMDVPTHDFHRWVAERLQAA